MKILIAIPVLNEEKVLRSTVGTVRAFADRELRGHETAIVIADNGSDDATPAIARELAASLPGVRHLRLAGRGKGLAIREAWRSEAADVYAFMDADLATDLSALPALVGEIGKGADLAVGSRFHPGSKVERTLLRRTFSLGYRALLRGALGTDVADVPCGFKAVTARVVREIMPAVRDDQWFFDTELVIRAERAGMRIAEVPVVWRELRPAGRSSKVKVLGLVAEYARKVLRLRREIGPRSDAPAAARRGERRVVLLASLAVMALTAIPPVLGAALGASRGLEWNGRQFLSPGDMAYYRSYIAQAASGAWLFENHFTVEAVPPVLNVLWLGVGLLARAARLDPIAAYHVARLALIPVLGAVAYAAVAMLLRRRADRIAAFLAFMFASGIGLYVAPFLSPAVPSGGEYEWPIDFWVAEANPFMSMLYSPHFVASFALIIASTALLLKAYETGRVRFGLAAGAAALVLFEFHPFHAPTLYAVGAAVLAARFAMKRASVRQAAAFAAFVAVSLPAVAYHAYLLYGTSHAFLRFSNLTITPSPFHVFVGLGALAFFAAVGQRTSRTDAFAGNARTDLVVWAVAHFLMAYAPLAFQRRLLEGLWFPLAVLAGPAIVDLWGRFKARYDLRGPLAAAAGLALAIIVFLPSTATAFFRSVDAYADPEPGLFFFSAEQAAALRWFREESPRDAVVLAGFGDGNLIAGWGERRVYAGHWAGTADPDAKERTIAAFFGAASPEERQDILAGNGITHVFVGPAERSYGGDVAGTPGLSPVFARGSIVIYAFSRP